MTTLAVLSAERMKYTPAGRCETSFGPGLSVRTRRPAGEKREE
jgi:hypothetical protein